MHCRSLVSGSSFVVALACLAGPASARIAPLLAGDGQPAVVADPTAVRAEARSLDVDRLAALTPGDTVLLNLFDDVALSAVVEQRSADGVMSGRLEGLPLGSWTIVAHADAMSGIVRAPGVGLFRLRADAEGRATVIEADAESFPACAIAPQAVAAPPQAIARQTVGAGLPDCANGTEIDVLVVYTPPARDAIGGTSAMEAEIALAAANTNTAYANSGIDLQINIVHVTEVAYEEDDTYGGHLGNLGDSNDGIIDEIHGMRYVHQADMVAMMVADGTFCGIAWLMFENSPAAEGIVFSVTTIWCAAGNMTFAHELGHNMGCCHAPGDGGGCFSGGLYDYSVGYRYNGNSGTLWRTVMAYSPGNRIMNFSNPFINFDGEPTGIANDSDNALTINETRTTIANFRCGLPFCDVQSINGAEVSTGDGFGADVDLAGDVAIAGASFHNDFAGSAYVFRYDDGSDTWNQEARLEPAELGAGDIFGHAVSTSGERVAIGAQSHDAAANGAGAAWVYRHEGGNWVHEQMIEAPDAEAGDAFGSSVAIKGDVLAVGAAHADGAENDSGAVYLYRRDGGGVWSHEQTIAGPAGTASERFGKAVALDGDRLLVGAPRTAGTGETGTAHVYRYEAGTWQAEGTLAPPVPSGYTGFGLDVSISGSVAVAGAPSDNYIGSNSGTIFVFRFDGGSWDYEDELTPADLSSEDAFGASVTVDGNTIVAGGSGDNDHGPTSGSAYVFRHNGAFWEQRAKLLPLDGGPFEFFGNSLALDGLRVVGGAFSTPAGGTMYAFSGFTGDDCNGNSIADDCEILSGDVPDANGNGIPDTCDVIGDLDGDGSVGVTDMLQLLGSWGPCDDCGACVADLDGDCTVGTSDFLALLANWG